MYKFIFVINSTNYVVEALYKHKTVPGRVLLQLRVFSAPYSSVIFTVKLTFFLGGGGGGGGGGGVSNSSGEVINRDYGIWILTPAKSEAIWNHYKTNFNCTETSSQVRNRKPAN